MSQEKIKFPVKFTPEQRQELETWYAADNCQDRSEFMVKAMEFYIDYLKTSKAESFLPIAISAAIQGELGGFTKSLVRFLFKQSVELEMLCRLMADENGWPRQYLESIRSESVAAVKATNGSLKFIERAELLRGDNNG